jgi:hypothetical protein
MTLDELSVKLDELAAEVDALKRPSPYAKIRETRPNAGKAWSKSDDEELSRLYAGGSAVSDLALLFGRTENGVRQRLERLGLMPAAA